MLFFYWKWNAKKPRKKYNFIIKRLPAFASVCVQIFFTKQINKVFWTKFTDLLLKKACRRKDSCRKFTFDSYLFVISTWSKNFYFFEMGRNFLCPSTSFANCRTEKEISASGKFWRSLFNKMYLDFSKQQERFLHNFLFKVVIFHFFAANWKFDWTKKTYT